MAFNIFKAIEYPEITDDRFSISAIQGAVAKMWRKNLSSNSLEHTLISGDPDEDNEKIIDTVLLLDAQVDTIEENDQMKPLHMQKLEIRKNTPTEARTKASTQTFEVCIFWWI